MWNTSLSDQFRIMRDSFSYYSPPICIQCFTCCKNWQKYLSMCWQYSFSSLFSLCLCSSTLLRLSSSSRTTLSSSLQWCQQLWSNYCQNYNINIWDQNCWLKYHSDVPQTPGFLQSVSWDKNGRKWKNTLTTFSALPLQPLLLVLRHFPGNCKHWPWTERWL